MKILLAAINAKYIHVNLAVRCIERYAKNKDSSLEDTVTRIEYTINHTLEEIREAIVLQKPDVLCFSCYIWNRRIIEALLEDLPKLLPSCKIWVGGPEVTYDCEQFLEENPAVLGVMKGEGEAVFLDLCQYYTGTGKAMLSQIQNLVFRLEDNGYTDTGFRYPLKLEEVPFVYDEETIGAYANKILYYESSRGCPFSCSYCLSSLEKYLRIRPFEMVKEELDFFLRHRVPQVKFVDRTFNCNHKHALQIWQYIKEHDNGVTNFHFEIAGDLLNEEEIELLQSLRPGLIQMEIGVQSTNLDTITEINRKMDLDVLRSVVEKLKKNENFHIHLDLIAGLPYENYESFRRSFDDVYRMGPNELQLGFLKVLKGSKIAREQDHYGIAALRRAPYEVLYTSWISHEELLKLKLVEEMLEVHFNSMQFPRTMQSLVLEYDRPIECYEALGAFYENGGFLSRKVARGERFEILNSFIRNCFPEEMEKYRFLLTMDLYGRENQKNRPAWAGERVVLSEDHIREFYLREKEEGTLLPAYRKHSVHQIQSMTHLERIPDERRSLLGLEEKMGDWYALFDYQKRSPVTENVPPIFLTIER